MIEKDDPGTLTATSSWEYNETIASQSVDWTQVPVDWTEEEERKIVRKIDCIVLPLLMLGFMALQYDKGNIGNVLTDNFLRDVGITQYQFNVGNQLLFAGIVVLEIPSNLIMYKIGCRAWLSGQILAWGLVSLFQTFQKGLVGFFTTRLLLGFCEAGFAPAALYCLTTWYKSKEMSHRFAWTYNGAIFAGATSGLISYGVLRMRGIAKLAGWQWVFIIEGLFTLWVGILFVALFPKDPAHPVSFLGIRIFNERETHILVQRVLTDDPTKARTTHTVSKAELVGALSNWTTYPHLFLEMAGLAPLSTMMAYAPTLVQSFGYPMLKANALASAGTWISFVLSVAWGYLADKTRKRGLWVLLALLLRWGFMLGCRILVFSKNGYMRYALFVLTDSFTVIWHPMNGSWLALNARSPGERAVIMGMFTMSANCAGIVGAQIFQRERPAKIQSGMDCPRRLELGGRVALLDLQSAVFGVESKAQEESGRGD